jgi:hypothetical protein
MMTIDDKLDKLLVETITIRTVVSQHSAELLEMKEQLKPVFFHVAGVQVLIKVFGGLVCLGTLIVSALLLWK